MVSRTVMKIPLAAGAGGHYMNAKKVNATEKWRIVNMDSVRQQTPSMPFPKAPLLARWTAPAGPALPRLTFCGGARVLSVPGRYTVSHLIEGPEGIVVMDLGSAEDIQWVGKAAEWLGKPVKMLVPSHLHFDHCVGIEPASASLNAEVALSAPAMELVKTGSRSRGPKFSTLHHFWVPYLWQGLPGPGKGDLPGGLGFGFPWSKNRFSRIEHELRDGEPVPFLDGWTALFTPGHTDECVSLYHREAGFLVCGDTIRNYQGGEWDPIVTDFDAYARTRDRLNALDIQAIFPGHGPVIAGRGVMGTLKLEGVW
jgi:glyoxylase-like metal-dependent hydrolase (beta-lactamase superfamily II)